MKKSYLSLIVSVLLVVGIASAGYITIPRVDARMMQVIVTGSPPADVGGGGADFTDDFTSANLSAWRDYTTEASCGAVTTCRNYTLQTGTDDIDSDTNDVILYNTSTGSASHYVAALASTVTDHNGLYFRSDGTNDTAAYCIRKSSGDLLLRYCTGASCTTFKDTNSLHNFSAGDGIGVEVTGTNTDTVIKVWIWDTVPPPERGSWGTCTFSVNDDGTDEGCTTDYAWDSAPTYANTGTYVGFYNGSTNDQTWDDFMGGDI